MTGRRGGRGRTPRATSSVPTALTAQQGSRETTAPARNTRAASRQPSVTSRPDVTAQGGSAYGSPADVASNVGLSLSKVQRGFSANFDQHASADTGPPSSPLATHGHLAAPARRQPTQRMRTSPKQSAAVDQPESIHSATSTVAPAPARGEPQDASYSRQTPDGDPEDDHYRKLNHSLDNAFLDGAQLQSHNGFPISFDDMIDSSSSRRGMRFAIFIFALSALLYSIIYTPVVPIALLYMKHLRKELPMTQALSLMPSLGSAIITKPPEVAINFFSRGAGATVDPRLSTPSMYHFKNVGDRSNYPLLNDFTTTHQPNQALQPYFEIGDAWCTSTRHLNLPYYQPIKAQLAVNLAHAVYPRSVVVQSPPSWQLLDPSARPGAMSLWVQVKDSEARQRTLAAVRGIGSEHQVLSTAIGHAAKSEGSWFSFLSSKPPVSDLALDESWVRVASRGHAEVLAADGQVFFNLDADMEAIEVPVHRAVFRVESNLGQDYTCLYQVSLTGKLVSA